MHLKEHCALQLTSEFIIRHFEQDITYYMYNTCIYNIMSNGLSNIFMQIFKFYDIN